MATNSATIKKTVGDLLKDVSTRNRDIISRRFGLKTGKKETLESIGASYGITRERVRQIEESTLSQLRTSSANNTQVAQYVRLANEIIGESGNIIKEQDLFESFSGKGDNSVINASLAFMLTLSPELIRYPANDDFHSFWARNSAALTSFKTTTQSLIDMLSKTGRVVSQQDFNYLANKNNISGFAATGKPLSESEVSLCLEISKNLDRNIFNEVGLASWSDIRPKGVRDKAYLVLKRSKEPRHFSQIAQLINTMGLGKRKANVQTVHNELIKDDRFVLVGRGMYALAEWGYKAGTVKDVLVDILRSSKNPLAKDVILAKVRDARLVKENTILLNLQDTKTFIKNSDGTYTLK